MTPARKSLTLQGCFLGMGTHVRIKPRQQAMNQKLHPHYRTEAAKIIRNAEADLNRTLSLGEKRDLLADNTDWSLTTIRQLIELMYPEAAPQVQDSILTVTHEEHGRRITRVYDFRTSAGRHAFQKFASWALNNRIEFKSGPTYVNQI